MRRIIYLSFVFLILIGCEEKYKLSTGFTSPTNLNSPLDVNIDVKSTENILLTWTGGGAEDGSYVIYEVLFDKPDGNFSNPVYRTFSDNGVESVLTLTHATLNSIARKVGIKPGETGNIIWTVVASKAGEIKKCNLVATISVTRPEGLEIPTTLFLYGSGSENGGQEGIEFRQESEGKFVVYTKVQGDGQLILRSTQDENAIQYCYVDNKLKEGTQPIYLTPNEFPYRITVDFNTLSLKTEIISRVRAIWGVNFDIIGELNYVGNGIFRADNCEIKFVQQSRPETNPPSWLTWVEERYYFIATIDGNEWCWGRKDEVSPERPTGNEPLSFYEIGEFPWSQWDHLWKMSGTLDLKKCTIVINTNLENMMVHQFSNIVPL